ncbi:MULTISPECIES: hypothetical protein [Dyella]|uniref:Uncharacterized protein n=2 Tax=Dyella TaxID=231454 RepID=A0A4R0YVJ6_9GAMM|nr:MULTISPECIES: hypothetical protein [Dyella]TBR38966.1 hypothetical protein EYV96_01575 [Dyella terrae]TCI13443.1 hypothetical protein EZM97_09295 [Dyella soli]
MKPRYSHLTLASVCAVFLLAACAEKPARTTSSSTSTTVTSAPSGKTTSTTRSTTKTTKSTTAPAAKLPENTGIPACDDYLSSYIACHQAANIYAPDQIEGRYEMMRNSLLRDSIDPDIRPQLGARCMSLSNQLKQALHGKSCNASPATTSSVPVK